MSAATKHGPAGLRDLRAMFREELLLSGAPACPHEMAPPSALASEEIILSALLCGHVSVADVAPLRAEDFYGEINSALFAAVEASPVTEDEPFAATTFMGALRAQGVAGPDSALEARIIALRDGVPWIARWREHRDAIVEMARRRRLLDQCGATLGALRVGALGASEAVRRLREVTL